MTKEEAKQLMPFDIVHHINSNKDAIVKEVTNKGVFCVFKINSEAKLCRFSELKKL